MYCYAAGKDSNWILVGSGTHSDIANFDRIGFLMKNGDASSFSTWAAVFGVDFIRVITGVSSFPL
jgi:hypothetical protein